MVASLCCCMEILLLTWSVALGAFFLVRLFFARRRDGAKRTVAFFHPYCNAGGGGERVLWCAVRETQKYFAECGVENGECVVYTGDWDAEDSQILARYLRWRVMVEAGTYPCFTLLGQSLGGAVLGLEALWKASPDVFLDTMGYAFALPVFRFLAGSSVGSYVHYPVISTDMLEVVWSRSSAHNNQRAVARSRVLSGMKMVYYVMFAKLYGLVGRSSHVTMANSTWTYNHIVQLWQRPNRTRIVYPPCDVESFGNLEVKSEEMREKGRIRILSIAQFRPEKNHRLQLAAFKILLDALRLQDSSLEVSLVLAGSCRHDEDRGRVEGLKEECEALGIGDCVEWRLNISFAEMKEELSLALIGLHTMWNEHFGIGVVESMAAGNIMVAHNSGGPKMDIVGEGGEGDSAGFLAQTPEEYADIMGKIIRMTPKERTAIRDAAKIAVRRFSEASFNEGFRNALSLII